MKILIKFAVVGLALLPLSGQPQTFSQKVEFCDSLAEVASISAKFRDLQINKSVTKQLLAKNISDQELLQTLNQIVDSVYDVKLSPDMVLTVTKAQCYQSLVTQ